jgi:hypothetical protein
MRCENCGEKIEELVVWQTQTMIFSAKIEGENVIIDREEEEVLNADPLEFHCPLCEMDVDLPSEFEVVE